MKRLFMIVACVFVMFSISANAQTSPSDVLVRPGHASVPGYCEIEVANQSSLGAYVDILYDNYERRHNIFIAPGYSLFIPLYYYNYCHSAATISIYSTYGDLLYYGNAYVGQTITVVPGLKSGKQRVTQ